MSTITIKNLPDGLHKALKSRAKAHGRSLNKEIITTLNNFVYSSRIDVDQTIRQAQLVRESMGVYLTQDELTNQKNEGRR